MNEHHGALRDAIGDLVGANRAMLAAKVAQERAVQQILEAVAALRQEVDAPHDPQLVAVLRHLYWQHDAVPSRQLSKITGFRSPHEMAAAIGPVPSGITCDNCSEQLMRTSRSWKPPYGARYGQPTLCKGCERDHMQIRDAKWHLDTLRRRHVEAAPVAAPADEWRVATTLVLAYPPITVSQPDAEDRDGFWWAYESAQAVEEEMVTAAGADASVAAAIAARVVSTAQRVVGWDQERTWDLLGPITQEAPTAVLTRLARRIRDVEQHRKAEAARLYPDDYQPADGWQI